MDFTGTFDSLMVDFTTKNQKAVLTLNEDARAAFDKLKNRDKVSITIKEYRKKRSLDANNYYWTLLTKLATVMKLSNPEAHNMMLYEYGFDEVIAGHRVLTPIPDTEESENTVKNAMYYHLKPTSEVKEGKDGVMYRTYKLLRGTHTYDTAEMSRLIDGLITRCKEAGIPDSEIATPDEKRLLKDRYGVDIG